MPITRTIKLQKQAETEIAVLQVQVKNVEDKVEELKVDLKDVKDTVVHHTENTHSLIKEMKSASEVAHSSLSKKISALEKWRWMMMGAGIVLGALGFDTIGKLLK